jgi:hypothetical protein
MTELEKLKAARDAALATHHAAAIAAAAARDASAAYDAAINTYLVAACHAYDAALVAQEQEQTDD